MRCDKIYGECVNKKLIILKDTLPLIPLKILPVALNTLDLLFLPLSEAVQYVLFCECLLLRCHGCLDVLNRFQNVFPFKVILTVGEEPEVAWCYILLMRWLRTHRNIFV